MNEEEVKLKVVYPFLRRLGLLDQDLAFETSFSLQLGTSKVTIDGKARDRSVGARLDTLVKNDGRNLLILELKEENHALCEEDRDQAISYARLVHPIAPYAIVTNGRDWQIFDTVTKALVDEQAFKVKDGYSLVLPEADRQSALEFILGYSRGNLMAFCKAQVAERLKPLKGSVSERAKKYIPELTVPRKELEDALREFEASSFPGFLLLAESGSGKTSALCAYAEARITEGKPTLFYSGISIEAGLLEAIALEFNWLFSEELSPVQLVRRLDRITRGAPLVVIVDAIDEWQYPARAQNLISILSGCRNHAVKVVLSCRAGAWEGIAEPRGSDIGMAEYLHKVPSKEDRFVLAPFTEEEFFSAVEKYRDFYGVNGAFEDEAFKEAKRNPFVLRMLFATAADLGGENLTFSLRKFFSEYWRLLLEKCGRSKVAVARAQLLAIARMMFEQNAETVGEDDVRKALALSVNESLLPALIETDILQFRNGAYSFYFQHLRNYLIAFEVYRWDQAKPAILKSVERLGVRGQALAFFVRYASAEQMDGIAHPMWENAGGYLALFDAVIRRHFPALLHEIVPGEDPDLGFVAEYLVQENRLAGYGFRKRKPTEPAVMLIPVEKFFSRSNLLTMTGVDRLHHRSSSDGFTRLDIRKEVAEFEVIDRVSELIKAQSLSLHGSDKLADEALISAVNGDPDLFSNLMVNKRQIRLPISSEEVREAILREKLRQHFEHELTEQKLKSGEIKTHNMGGGFVTHSRVLTKEEKAGIPDLIESAVTTGRIPELNGVSINMLEFEEELRRTDALENGHTTQCLPWHTAYYFEMLLRKDYSRGAHEIRHHIRSLKLEFLTAYRTVVDRNFPTLKAAFELRAEMPIKLYLNIEVGLPEGGRFKGSVLSAYEKLQDGDNEVVLCGREELTCDPDMGVCYRGRLVSANYSVAAHLNSFMGSLGDRLITKLVYEKISREWPTASDELRAALGLRRKKPNVQ